MRDDPVLPDVLGPDLRVLFVGFNPSVRAGEVGHHYAGRGNQFWRLLADARLTPRLLAPAEDRLAPSFGIGLTNLVARPTRTAAELSRAELRAGVPHVERLVREYGPWVVAYAGKGVYLAAAGLSAAPWGAQEGALVGGVVDFVLPSPSGLARLPYGVKLAQYRALSGLLSGGPVRRA